MTDTNQEVPKYTIFISTTYKKEYKKISNQEAKKNATKEILKILMYYGAEGVRRRIFLIY